MQAQSQEPLTRVASLLEGTYNTYKQAEQDTDYYHISLLIIPIWKNRQDGFWFYVEQAMATTPERPYRQRVYHLTQKYLNEFESAVFNIHDPLRFAGKPQLVEELTEDSLQLKEGCSVFLKEVSPGEFSGGTAGKDCSSDLRGASYATSEVTLSLEGLRSWDRGFNKEDKQVWGAEKGPYIFLRKH